MAKDLTSSSRIPRLDGISRIPLPGSIRIQQPQQQTTTTNMPPPSIVPQKILSTTKITRPNSFSGLKEPGISTMASIKKSLSGERFSEAANIMSRKTATVMKKFLTKPEKSEKNIEMKSHQDNKLNSTVILEKGSKECSNEKSYLVNDEQQTTSLSSHKPLTRSDTFIRDCNDTSTVTQFDPIQMTENMIQSTPVSSNNLTKILDKSKEKWGITQDIINQSNSIMSPTKILNQNTKIHQKHLIGITQPLQSTSMNCTKISDKTKISKNQDLNQTKIHINNLTKTLDSTNLYQNIDKSIEQASFFNNTLIDGKKMIRKSQCFGDISKLSVNETNLLESKSYEHLNNISIPKLDLDETIKPTINKSNDSLLEYNRDHSNQILITPNKKDLTLILNSTIQDEHLLDITQSPESFLNITHDIVDDSPTKLLKNNTKLLYMSPIAKENFGNFNLEQQNQCNISSSRNSLIRTPDDYIESMEVDDCGNVFEIPSNVQQVLSLKALQELKQTNKPRFSFGLDLTECTLDCSIELCDISLASNGASIGTNNGSCNNVNNSSNLPLTSPTSLKKQNSFELDESLGILTPDQMKEFLDSNTTNTNNLDLPLGLNNLTSGIGNNINNSNKLLINHQMRIDQTPSPEELPLDPVGVKTDTDDIIMELPPQLNTLQSQQQTEQPQLQPQLSNSTTLTYTELSQTDTDSKTDQMTKSNVSKVSTSFITSVTSITSLDTGYQGDGEMSRPASRSGNVCDHSPSNGPRNHHQHHHHKLHQIARQPSFNNQQQNIPIRRQDPMTDSDFFTESDADVDIFHRGDRRAQVIDGQLYGPSILQQPATSVFISEQPEMEDSCMESSGIFTDVENRCDDDLAINRTVVIQSQSQSQDIDMSPDGSTDTVKSNTNQQLNKTDLIINNDPLNPTLSQGQLNQLSDSQTSSTINSSFSSNSISTDYNQPIQFKKQQNNFTTPTIESIPNDITIINHTTNNTTNYKQQQQQNHHDQQQIKAFPNNPSNVNISAHSVKKLSPSRKHVVNNLSSTSSSGIIQAGLKYDNKKILSSANNNKSLIKNVNNSTLGIQRVNKKLRNSNDMINKRLTTKNHNNQENKSPSASGSNNSSSISFSSTSGVGGGSGSTVNVGSLNNTLPNIVPIRKLPPNKWDAVMNKIAENKTLKLKKINYQQVKSKVSTGVLLLHGGKKPTATSTSSPVGNIGAKHINNNENSENIIKNQNKSEILYDNNSGNQSPIDNSKCSSSGLTSPQQKRLIQGAIKRGRSYSKDSQQSSQSDLSFSGGSPKLLAKTPTRSAKKRDVRNLSISPTDLGPPPKTQTTANTPNGITRTKNPTTILSQKRTSHLQPTNNTSTTHSSHKGSSPPPKKSSVRRPLDQKSHNKTPLNDHNRLIAPQQNGNVKTNGIITNGAAGNAKANSHTVASSTPVGSKLRNGTTIHNHSLASPAEKKQNQHQQKNKHEIVKQSGIPPPSQPPDKTVEALGVLLQYLAHDLDGFNCPIIKNEFAQAQKHLLQTNIQLEDAKTTCHELQDQLQDKEHYYITREQELQALHRCELNKVETSLFDVQTNAKERIASLELKLSLKDNENQTKFQAYVQETELKFNQQDKELQLSKQHELELQQRINELTLNENELRDKIQDAEDKFAERLQSAGQREKDLQEKLNSLNYKLDSMKKDAENKERDLESKLNVTQDEVTVLRHSRNSLAAAANNSTTKNENGGGASKVQMLQNEVESLRCVLEIKQNDIADLRKKNQEIIRENEELRSLQLKYSGIESRMEDLQIQLKTKDEENKELLVQLKQLKDTCKQESKNRTRLSLHNEELQWKLKQNSEKYAATITELSKSYQDKTGYTMSTSKISFHSQDNPNDTSNNSSLSNSHNRTNGSDRMAGCCFDMEDISPPASPIVKGVVEKSDSVSWVLEMDDETTPEVLASRMVRRAGSFRSSFNEKYSLGGGNGANKRQSSLPMGSGSPTINPLQQSASANMIIPKRQHSSDTNDSTPSIPKTRNRSNSVRGTESKNKLIRQNSVNSNVSRKHELQPTWKEPICTSSPYNRRMSARNSPPPSMQDQQPGCSTKQISKSYTAATTTDNEPNFFNNRKQSRHLITCDTSALTASERFEMQQRSSAGMPSAATHSSVQDLNALKKFQEIQESAGEAMVSGTNSEDESCSASSDDSPTSSNSSLGVGHHNNKQHMSIEEALLLNKMNNSFGGTPMEVSWSSDAEQFPSESIV